MIHSYICSFSPVLINFILCSLYTKGELNYMDPSNLEFSQDLHSSARKRDADQTVQYGNLAEAPQYSNIM